MSSLIVNELLAFVSVQSDKLPRDHIHTAILDSFSLDETSKAKNILLIEFDKILDADLIKVARKQRQTGQSGAKQKIVKDILDIWQIVDKEAAGKVSATFVAADINRLPSLNADNSNLQFLISAILKLQEQTEYLKEEA